MQIHTYRDFDAFAADVRDVDSVMMLQNPTHRHWSISHVDLPGIHVQLGRLGSGNIVEGQSWPQGTLIYLPLTEDCLYSANGTALAEHSFMILEPGCEFCVSTRTEHDWCSIFVPIHLLEHGDDPADPPSGLSKPECRATRPDPRVANTFLLYVRQVMSAAASCAGFESAPAAGLVEAELLKLARLILGKQQEGTPEQEGRPRVSRPTIIRRSRDLLEARAGERVSVRELTSAAGVSERTLRTAFNDYFGVGPAHYLQLRQLHQVHRALRAAGPGSRSVTDVLVRHGVWEFGHFASRYHRLFGETPSKTLRTKHRR